MHTTGSDEVTLYVLEGRILCQLGEYTTPDSTYEEMVRELCVLGPEVVLPLTVAGAALHQG
jgi:hypothetical protein